MERVGVQDSFLMFLWLFFMPEKVSQMTSNIMDKKRYNKYKYKYLYMYTYTMSVDSITF